MRRLRNKQEDDAKIDITPMLDVGCGVYYAYFLYRDR